jgi:hypothetical protein
MDIVRQSYLQLVKYEIYCEQSQQTIELSIDPIGWDNDDKEFARNEDYDGIITKFSNNLKFVGDSADFIKFQRTLYGIQCKLKLTKYEKHPKTRKWVKTYWGYLAMKTYSFEDNQVSIKFNSGGLEEIIKSRETEDVEIDRLDTLDSKTIEPLQENEVALDGRKIFLKSKWEANNTFNPLRVRVYSADGNTRYTSSGFPLSLTSRSHEQAQSTIPTMGGPANVGNNGRMILAVFDRSRTIRVYGRNLSFKPIIYPKNLGWAMLKISICVYENGIDYNLKQRYDIFHAGHQSTSIPNVFSISGQTFSLNFDQTIDVSEGDSISLEIHIGSDTGPSDDFVVDFFEGFSGDVYAEEESYFPPSKSKFVFVHDVLKRLTQLYTSKQNAFYSEYFGRTDGAFVGLSHGFWIRGFDKLPLSTEDFPNLFKPMTTNLKEAIESCKAVFNIGMGIEEYQNQERIRIEDKTYFYNRNVTIKLPNQVKNVKRYEAEQKYYSSIEIGYEAGGNYEEAQGLDEPNGTSNFITNITAVKETYSALSKYRADSYGKEFARRKQASSDDTLDTQYDDEIWFLDLKKGLTEVYEQRKWQDDFEQIPTGVFAPETADNLRLSPVNNLLRHSWVISSGLTKYPTDYLKYGSSTANSKLTTKLIGGIERAENGDILNAELTRPRFVNEWIEFEHICDFEVMQKVQGTTIINGKEIKNFYGLVEFLNEDNVWEKGFLFNLKPNDKGKWKLLKANI